MNKQIRVGEGFEQLVEIIDTLRSEQGCPWDREQDENSIVNYFLEEVYEAVDAVAAGSSSSLKEELGDVLMEVVFLARIYKEKDEFSIEEILEGINKKMIRRHPHVFGPKRMDNSARVLEAWNRQKITEKERSSVLEGLATHLPSLLKAFQIGQRVSAFGFDWSQPEDALLKVKEEISELEKALESGRRKDIAEEIGDLLFSLANVSRHLEINPEVALRQTNNKFIKRFKFVENKLREEGKNLGQVGLEELDQLWEESKS
jgi:tetrapyrrole methylase family protein/MazG family protein